MLAFVFTVLYMKVEMQQIRRPRFLPYKWKQHGCIGGGGGGRKWERPGTTLAI